MKKYRTLVKQIVVLSIAFVLSMPMMAQDNKKQVSTLFGGNNGHISHGGWAGLNFGYTQINGKDTYLMGAQGGWLINHQVTIGLAGNGFISDKEYDIEGFDTPLNLAGGYGGLFLEFTIAPYSPVHIAIPLTIGAGGVTYTRSSWWEDENHYHDNYSVDSDAFFVIEPGLEVEFNVIKFMRLAVGGSYRYTSKVDLVETSGTLLRGFNGYFGLKFGWF